MESSGPGRGMWNHPRDTPSYSKDTHPRDRPSYSKDTHPRDTPSYSKDTHPRDTPSYSKDTQPRDKPSYSKDTQDMIQLMMQQSRLTNFQQRQISLCLKNGKALPLTCNPTSSAPPPQPKPQPIRRAAPSAPPQRRSAESCRSGDSYTRERFRPGPTRDLEKEKRRLQNILATGREEEPKPCRTRRNVPESTERDRFQEVLDEIEERRAFLADMTALGQEKRWVSLIDTEISQKVRELELMDKARTVDTKEAEVTTSDQTDGGFFD